jgi:NAD(P)-dependent dehydrogenase (short-subunit alcohol dehydrogenase family)
LNSNKSFADKIILITGSTDGLGKLIATDVARQGAVVLLHGRDPGKGRSVLDEIARETGNENLKYYNGDYSSLHEVSLLAGQLLRYQPRIDILINNVGIGKGQASNEKPEISADGIELRLAVNYVGHVLLTEKLLPLIPPGTGKIINVASIGQEVIDFSNLMLEKNYDGFLAYRRSKTALIMYTIDLAERLRERGIKVNAVHPASLMNTKMVLEDWGHALTTVEQGAEAVENLLEAETTGEYYDGKKRAKPIAQVYDKKAREELQRVTDKLHKGFS